MNPTDPQSKVCSFCNWSSTGLLNIGETNVSEKWICHGCVKRELDRRDELMQHAHNCLANNDAVNADAILRSHLDAQPASTP